MTVRVRLAPFQEVQQLEEKIEGASRDDLRKCLKRINQLNIINVNGYGPAMPADKAKKIMRDEL